MRTILSIALLISLSAAVADEFSLIDKEGEKYGPILLREGATVKTAQEQLTVTEIKRRDEGLKTRLMKIMVPELLFENASLGEVVQLFQEASRKYDKSRIAEQGKGVTLTIVLDYDGENIAGEPPREDSWRAKIRTAEERGKRTGKTANAPLWSALEAALAQFDAKPLARDGIVLVVDHGAPETPLVVRNYPVRPMFIERLGAHMYPGYRPPEERDEDEPKKFFRSMGVSWPNGSSIRHIGALGSLVVVNTAENLRAFEDILLVLDVQPSQLEIELQFVAFKKSDIAALAVKGMVGGEELQELREQGKSELLACPKVVTKSGSEAVIKSVKECIYPTEFTATSVSTTNTNQVAVLVGTVVEPSGFEMREVGTILEVAPDVSPEGQMIDLTFTPQMVHEPEWHDYGCDVKGRDGKKHRIVMQQPFFYADTISTSVSLFAGESMFIGGGAPSKDPTKVVYMFVSARLVGANGKPLNRQNRPYSR